MPVIPLDDPTGALLHAISFASLKHSTQRRKDPDATPYINHPIGVAHILYFEGDVRDTDVLCAAVLHDTVEDTDCTLDELSTVFSPTISQLVSEVTDDKSLPKEERKRLQVLKTHHKSHGAKLIKMADKLYNLRDIMRVVPEGWDKGRVIEYFQWAQQVVRGCRGANAKLESALDDVFQFGTFKINGSEYKCIPN